MPNLLFLTCHLPYPLISGGRRREHELISRLAADFQIHLLAITKTYGEDVENATLFEDMCSSVTLLPAEADETSRDPFQVRRHACADGRSTVARLIEQNEIDIVHAEAFYVMQHVPETISIPVFLQEQNIEYLLWKQRAERACEPEEKAARLWEYLRTLEAERNAWERAAMCGAVSVEDLAVMREALPHDKVRLVPDGFDHLGEPGIRNTTPAGTETGNYTLLFMANFGYQPNVDAALYLCREIWPLIARDVPGADLLLVGNAPPPEIEDISRTVPGVEVTGRVPDMRPYLDHADLVVCPLRIGGGIKVKVLESMSRGKAIVTTSVGAQGIPEATKSMRIVDNPRGFARATVELLRDPGMREALGRSARAQARMLPTWDEAATALGSCYDSLLAAEHGARRGETTRLSGATRMPRL